MSDQVQVAIEDDVARITMDDGKANALGPAMIDALQDAFDQAEKEASAVLLTGRPGVLSAGFDLKVMKEGEEAAAAMVAAGAELLSRIYLHPQPVVIASTGHAIAAGALLLCVGDHRISATGEISIGLNETSIGMALPVFGVEIARDRLLPTAHAEALLGAMLYDPVGAAEIGYVDEIAEPEALETVALDVLTRLKGLDSRAYGMTKRNLRLATIDRIRPSLERGVEL